MSNKNLNNDNKYQVWITSYPINGTDEASKYDKGYDLVDSFNLIDEAFWCAQANRDYSPIITKIVNYEIEIKDISEK